MNKTINSFVRQTLAFITGDTATVTAETNKRKSEAYFGQQLGELTSRIVDAEMSLEEARENLVRAIHPETRIGEAKPYLSNIAWAQEAVDAAEENLENLRAQLTYWTKLKSGVFAEVPAETEE